VDKLLLTDDQAMTPRGMGDTTRPAPAAPAGLKTAAATRFDVSLVWQPAAEPEFHHYQVYRGREPGFRPGQEALVGSPSSPAFLDWGLEPGKAYHYAVTAVDTFGHESEPARLSAQTEALARRVLIALEAETGVSRQGEAKVERHAEASAGVYLVTPVETVTKTPYRLELPFEAPLADRYVVWVSCFPVTDEHVFFNVGMDGKVSALFYCHNSRKGAPAQRLVWRPLGALSGPTPLIWNLDQGPHAVTLSLVGDAAYAGRVFALDRVIVTNDLSFVPPGRVWDWQATPEAGKP
jgi:hypothetical protein